MGEGEIDAGRLVLRPVAAAVARALLEGRSPPGVRFAPDYPSRFSLEVMELLAGERETETEGFRAYFLVRKADGAVLGEIGASTPQAPDTVQVGYSVVESGWGRGYATDALRALLDHLLAQPGVRRVAADTLVGHVASRRVMEKAGMRLCGARLEEEDGELVELVTYEIDAPAAGRASQSPRSGAEQLVQRQRESGQQR